MERTLKTLTLREKIAQLVQIRVPGKFVNRRSPGFIAIGDEIRRNRVGGLVLFAGNVYESAILLNELQSLSKLPLLVAADFERGVSFRIEDATSFPWAMAVGATGNDRFAYQEGEITGQESRALGVHWIFAPVVDVNNNPDNPVINIRSFGEDPALVARMGAAFIRGAKKAGVLTTAKHFPGHGDTAADSHIRLPVVESDMARLQSVELEPFKSAIEAGVDSIMTAHVAVPQLTKEEALPATLSPGILTGLLRDTLGFRGIVVTDALEMGGITNRYWCGLAAVRAIQAGADVLLLPPNSSVAINEVERAVKLGIIPESRIEASARKILEAKHRVGLERSRLVSITRIGQTVAAPRSLQLAQEIADHSITAIKDNLHLLPVNPADDTRIFSLTLTPDSESSPGSIFQAEMRRRFPSIRTAWVNNQVSADQSSAIDRAISESDLILCSTLSRLVSGLDADSIPESHRAIFARLAAARKPVIWIAFGNPYVFRQIPKAGTHLCTFSHSDVSQIAAARAIAGEIDINGKMPVSIPGFAKAGDGMLIPKLDMILKPAAPESFGFPADAFQDARQVIVSAVETGQIPGAQLIVGYQGAKLLELNAGRISHIAGSPIVTSNTLYDLASFSAPVCDASAAMLAKDSGILIPEAPVRDYLPDLVDDTHEDYLIKDLLQAVSKREKGQPGESGRNTKILETIISRAAGISFDRYLAGRLFGPLGMRNTFRKPPQNYRGGIARSDGPQTPSLWINAGDLAVFAQMLLNRGIYRHHRIFRAETVAALTALPGAWNKPSRSDWTGSMFSSAAFGQNSPSGSRIWIDPEAKLFIVFLTNAAREDSSVSEIQEKLGASIVSVIHGSKPNIDR